MSILLAISSHLPLIQSLLGYLFLLLKSNPALSVFSRFINILGTYSGIIFTTLLNGATVREVPIMIIKSQLFLIYAIALENLAGKLSPNNTISGFTGKLQS